MIRKTSSADNAAAACDKPRLKLGALRGNLGYLTRLARNVLRHSSAEFVGELGFITGQVTMLGLVAANPGVPQNELAGAMLMRKSQITGLIQDLVARGLVSRSEMGGDRRFNALSLTAAGKQAWQGARTRITRHSDSSMQALNSAERAELARLLRKLIAANLPADGIDFE